MNPNHDGSDRTTIPFGDDLLKEIFTYREHETKEVIGDSIINGIDIHYINIGESGDAEIIFELCNSNIKTYLYTSMVMSGYGGVDVSPFEDSNSKCIVLCKIGKEGTIKEVKLVQRESYDSRSYHVYKDNIHYFFYNKTKMKDGKPFKTVPEFSVTTIRDNWEVEEKTTDIVRVTKTIADAPICIGVEYIKESEDGKTIYFLGRTDSYFGKLLLLKYDF